MSPGIWTNAYSDLQLIVHIVYARGSKCWKIKGTLVNKKNGIVYQTIRKVPFNHKMEKV